MHNSDETSQTLTGSTIVIRRPEPLVATIDGEVVMLHPDEGAYFSLGATGSRVWYLLDRPISVDELCRTLTQEFVVDDAQCRADVVKFVSELATAGLVELDP